MTRAASLGVGDVGQAFLRMRENLVDEEIILLIEDVALIQGVRRDLLDAIVEPGVVQGEKKYATVRTMMAVTSGYYNESLPETFRLPGRADVAAVRRRRRPGWRCRRRRPVRRLRRAVPERGPGRQVDHSRPSRRTYANACSSCPVEGDCHENFGASADGFGLYPYNRPAILRAVKSFADLER